MRGTIIDARSRWTEERAGIVTEVTIRVERTIKGPPRGTVTVTALGGTVEGVTQWVEDQPQLLPGTEAFVFIKRDQGRGATVNGARQGFVPVANGRVMVQRAKPGVVNGTSTGVDAAQDQTYLSDLAAGSAVRPPLPDAAALAEPPGSGPGDHGRRALDAPSGTGAEIVITGSNFGTKASRESEAHVCFLWKVEATAPTRRSAHPLPGEGCRLMGRRPDCGHRAERVPLRLSREQQPDFGDDGCWAGQR